MRQKSTRPPNRFDPPEWAGTIYRTPFPVQPMRAIGAVAVSQKLRKRHQAAQAIMNKHDGH